MAMAIITIYQGASGSGEELAQAVAQSLGYGSIGREVLVEASLRYGIPEAKLNEILEKGPNWWERFLQNLQPYRIALQAAFCEIAACDGVVYHGHIGHELVPKFRHVLKIMLTAPMETRVEQVRARHELNEIAARRYVEEVDKARTRRLMALFGADWRDPSRYDLVMNLGHVSLETAKRLVIETVRSPDYQMSPASKQAFEDFALASRVQATLVLSKDMPTTRLDIKAKQGEISVSGTLPYWVSQDLIIRKITRIPGVKGVVADLVNIPAEIELGG
jgi:two-component system, OmpR family, response regulator CpxR